MENLRQTFGRYAVVVLLALTAFSYHPRFANLVSEQDVSNPLNKYIYVLAFACFALSFNLNLWLKNKIIQRYLAWIVICVFFFCLVSLIDGTSSYRGDLVGVILAFVFFLIGYGQTWSRNQFAWIIIIYAVSVAIATGMQIVTNIGGFVIIDQYIDYGKNTLGVMTASAAISCLILAVEQDKKFRILGCILFFVLLFFTITIRARAAYLVIFLMALFCLYSFSKNGVLKINKKKTFILAVLGVAVCCIVFPKIFIKIGDYIFDSFTQNRGADLTSDRSRRNGVALKLILQNPFLGNIAMKQRIDLVHNYLLRVVSSYGFVFAFPFVGLYFFLLKVIFKGVRNNHISENSMGYYVLIVPWIISLAEPTFPYSPGTGTILPFLLFGMAIRNDQMTQGNFK